MLERWDGASPNTMVELMDALRKALASTDMAGAEEWALIQRLRDEEADSVTILCDNPDGPPNAAVECCGFWTGFAERRFEGDTIVAALGAAVAAKDEAARVGYPELAAPPVEGLTSGEGHARKVLVDLFGRRVGYSSRMAVEAMLAFAAASPKATATASVRDHIAGDGKLVEQLRSYAGTCTGLEPRRILTAAADRLATLTDSGTAATIGGERT
ncbi:hypothetical protein MOP88_14125 [Sphingomonas sp. WKB10]|nr:hypothetical protein [Sphingomonas sp. WKB10]